MVFDAAAEETGAPERLEAKLFIAPVIHYVSDTAGNLRQSMRKKNKKIMGFVWVSLSSISVSDQVPMILTPQST